MNLFEPVLGPERDSGGSGGRRGRAGSMIAGRRKPGEPSSPPEEEERKPARRRRSTARKTDERERTEEEPRPQRRRRRSTAARKDEPQDDATAVAEEATAEEAEAAVEAAEGPGKDVIEQAEALEEPEAEASTRAPARSTPSRRTGNGARPEVEAPAELVTEVTNLRALVEEQRSMLHELRAGMLALGTQVDRSGYRPRLGVFVDVPNVMYGVEQDGKPVNMGRLLELLREGRELVRATAYSPVSDDPREPVEQQKFVAPFVPYEYRIVTKSLKRFADGSIKGNFDVEMAIEMLTMADRLDVIAIVSGDADFARAVEVVQTRGVRVEVIAFAGSTSLEMRALADYYLDLSTVVDRIT